MQTKMQFQKHADVISANGDTVGQLDRIVLDPGNKVVTHIVVHKGTLFNPEDIVVPIEMVAETNPDQIVLSHEAGDLESLAPFKEERLMEPQEDSDRPPLPDAAEMRPLIYGSPVAGLPIDPAVGEQLITHIEQNIPEGTVALKEGARVITADGKHVGNVERVLTDIPEEQVTHLMITKGFLSPSTKLIPIDWVQSVNEEEVNLLVNKVSIDELADTSSVR
jgi:sporulation protein YlmC with PRC-barrel domain